LKELLTVDIEKIVYGGQGMGRADGKVVFVPFTAPGDRGCRAILKEKKNYLRGAPTIERPSTKASPAFAGFSRCGGVSFNIWLRI
jgi:23S rRNA (uracil1939-C5)-methyltransferase